MPSSTPTARVEARVSKSQLMQGLADLFDARDWSHTAWSEYEAQQFEAWARRIRKGYNDDKLRAYLGKGNT